MKKILTLPVVFSLLLGACNLASPATVTETISTPNSDMIPAGTAELNQGGMARSTLQALADIGQRIAGSQGEAQAAQVIMDAFEQMGYQFTFQPFSVADASGMLIESANIIATRVGRSDGEIIVGAHYDSAGEGSGADDNASGVAVLLETASLLANASTPYTIHFVAFGAGEDGLLGSSYYRDHMSQSDFSSTLVMIDLDSLVAGDIAYIYGEGATGADLRDWTLEWAFGNELLLETNANFSFTDAGDGRHVSDYAPFAAIGIPVLYLETADWNLGNRDGTTQVDASYGENGVIRHTSYDTLAYLDATFPGRVDGNLSMFVQLLYHILNQYEVPYP